ncbi:hypothetical protein H9Q72_009538 [Fusarium xylarioides]|uniref:Uncharacterized protein n=1 Tax=Fusarium xylarioides TaxID=221167 RepID=A0A9P7HSC2_9HYPO|nr:hypothetical protein H9Q70_008149 [Fusarium xylarioides]KAG5762351.1 hypothetical protein H9Q72_009538 [Fusarium xylarioides]KAG5778162.1 hypothetical protein H9Q73_008173 [Fusarium xylarioides]
MGPDSITQDQASPTQKTSVPTTLIFDGQQITLENEPSIPLYRLSRTIACKVQKHCSIIFEQIEVVETSQPDGKGSRIRQRPHDLYYLVNSLLMLQRQHDTPACYLTAPSPKALGNIQVDVYDTPSQCLGFKAMLNADRSADDVQLFKADTQQILFQMRPKLKGGPYQWVDADGQVVAYESGREGDHKLVIQIPLQQDLKDALAALWTLRLWYEHVHNQSE